MNFKNICKAKSVEQDEWITGYLVEYSTSIYSDNTPAIIQEETLNGCFDPVLCTPEIIPVVSESICLYTGENDANNNPIFSEHLFVVDDFFGIIRYGKYKSTEGIKHIGFYIEWCKNNTNSNSQTYRNDFCYWQEKMKILAPLFDIYDVCSFIKNYNKERIPSCSENE